MSSRYLIGIGNETMTDDGVGPRVASALVADARLHDFQVVVIGHDTLAILSYFDEATDRIVFVDSVRMTRAAGEWAVFTPDDVETQKDVGRLTTHEGDVLRVIEVGRRAGLPVPSITILGIQPERVEPGLELSDTLAARFDQYLAAARALLRT